MPNRQTWCATENSCGNPGRPLDRPSKLLKKLVSRLPMALQTSAKYEQNRKLPVHVDQGNSNSDTCSWVISLLSHTAAASCFSRSLALALLRAVSVCCSFSRFGSTILATWS